MSLDIEPLENDWSQDRLDELIDLEQKYIDLPPAAVPHTMQVHIRELESHCYQLLQELTCEREKVSDLEGTLLKSHARTRDLQEQIEDVERRREDAVSTLFRLRPQRQECPETEIKQDYDLLKAAIEAWVEGNCGVFLDNETLGFEMIGEEGHDSSTPVCYYEIVLDNFRSRQNKYKDAKDQVLIAIIMRYVCAEILNHRLPSWLSQDQKVFFYDIARGMKELEPRKDLSTYMNWRSDTMVSLFNNRKYMDKKAAVARELAGSLFAVVRRTLPTFQDPIEVTNSLLSQVIEPSFALAQKIQCASNLWVFKYSKYWEILPGRQVKHLPGFLESIQEYHCINFSAHRKVLKPRIDLTTQEWVDRLCYLLDVFPGLYCQKLDVDSFLPGKTITQPVLLVEFAVPPVRRGEFSSPSRPQSGQIGQSESSVAGSLWGLSH